MKGKNAHHPTEPGFGKSDVAQWLIDADGEADRHANYPNKAQAILTAFILLFGAKKLYKAGA